jgi:glycosyltransferase involved in cell wall biosynthesis
VSQPLRIGIDARELLGDTTGVGRYLGELLLRWTSRPDADRRRFILYASSPLQIPLPGGLVEQRIGGSGRGTWWEQTWLRRAAGADRPDVFFAPAYTAPLAIGSPLAVTIHDVSFAAHPEWFRPREGFRRRWLTRRTARSASVILTVSEFSGREIARCLGVPSSKIQVVLNGLSGTVPASGSPSPNRGTVPASGSPSPNRGTVPALNRDAGTVPICLYVGSIFNRRRVPDLIAAFAAATKDLPDARLVIVGDDRTWPPQDLPAVARAHGVAGRTDFTRYVSDDELARLYARASVFAFLSEYEGFGFTPLEALAAGVPIVVLDTPVAREIYGNAAEFVQPGDLGGTAAALRRFMTSPTAADDLRARAPAVLSRYSWDRAADLTLTHLERVARR